MTNILKLYYYALLETFWLVIGNKQKCNKYHALFRKLTS